MNAYIEAFIAEHGSEDMVETWQDDENQTEFMKLAKKMNKGKKETSPKDPNKPKRGKSAYLFFCADNRAKTKEELGDDAKATEVTAELGKRWNELKLSDSRRATRRRWRSTRSRPRRTRSATRPRWWTTNLLARRNWRR